MIIEFFPVIVAQSDEAAPPLVEPDLLTRAERGRSCRRRRPRRRCPGGSVRGRGGGRGCGGRRRDVCVGDVVERAVGGDEVDAGVLAGPGGGKFNRL